MYKKKVSILLVLAMLLTLFIPQITASAAEVPEGYRKLLDVQIFKDKPVTGWSGSGGDELEAVNATLPVDSTETYNGLPSLRLNLTKSLSSGWFTSLLTVRGWNTHDLTQYVENGYLEFNIKGKVGGENFRIGMRDKVRERMPLEIDITKNITQYVDITTEWQNVKIPLIDIMDPTGIDTVSITCVVMGHETSSPFTVWLNDVKIVSPDNEKSAPAIKVNQVGFLPDSVKYALVTGFQEELAADAGTAFQVKNAVDGTVAFEGALTLVKDFEAVDSGEKILKADFSDLNSDGEYYISVSAEGIENSLKFKIGSDIYNPMLVDAARYFYYQRQGIELEAPYAQDYPRADITPQDSQAVFSSGKKPAIDVTKGWYDAGDFGKYVNAGATAVSDLFWAYEMFPEQFKDTQFNIPESGNGVPDILDEARWELEWMLKMQDKDSGGFYPRVQADNDEKITSRIIKDANGCTTDDTACATAVLAHAYIMYKDIDADFADECLESAKKAWAFLENNPGNIVSPSGPYNVSNDKSDRLWAAASLFRATGGEAYNTYFKGNFESFASKFTDPNGYASTWGDMWFTAFMSYLAADAKDSQIESWIDTQFDKWLNKIITRYENNPWENIVVPGNYFWGINMQIMNVPMAAIAGAKLLDKDDASISEMAFANLNWLLGTNPLRFSFVSGYGEDSCKGIFSNIYGFDNKPGIPNGYMPGGPNAFEGSGLSRFAAKCYTRSSGDWVANEHTVYWNAPLVFMLAYANNDTSAGPEPTPSPTDAPDITPTNTPKPTPSTLPPSPPPTTPAYNTPVPTTEPSKPASVDVNIDTTADLKPISPYIYGTNQDLTGAKVNARRLGGNRLTGYNWENNYSNAGSDYKHSSDTYLPQSGGLPVNQYLEPGAVASFFHDKSVKDSVPYTIITLQAAGYVSADEKGEVSEKEVAPSSRWKEVKYAKDAPFTLTPDTEDDYVYMDEFVNFLVNKYGDSATPTGIRGYSVDNEPALWAHTHARIHPEQAGCEEIVNKTVDLSKGVKAVDPSAEIFGPALYGYYAYYAFQDAPDWKDVKGNYSWFIDYYLDSMKKSSDEEGKRLLDVLDLHWYPEAQGGGHRITFGEDSSNTDCNKARLQAPRTLWDPSYTETSWITEQEQFRATLPLLPTVQKSIDKYYPGTKLAFTEYDYGGGKHITGGIATADVLGIFGKHGVYLSTYWGDIGNNYTSSALNLYTNYDGKGSTFGDTSVKCDTSDAEVSSAYASIVNGDDGKLHIILLNKNYEASTTFNLSINSDSQYKSGKVWAFDRSSSRITEKAPVLGIERNSFSYTLPALTACHIVLDTSEPSFTYGDLNDDNEINSVDYAYMLRYIMESVDNINIQAADLNLDGSINSIDYAILRRRVLKILQTLPYVVLESPVASFTSSPETGLSGEDIIFDASGSTDSDGSIANCWWDFGDGTEGLGATVKHQYKAPGSYKVRLIVTDNSGLSDTFEKTIKVEFFGGDTSDFGWEDGTLDGFYSGSDESVLSTSTDKAFKGSYSLKWDITGAAEGTFDMKKDCDAIVPAGSKVYFRVWIPANAPISAIQPYVMPHNADWTEALWNGAWGDYNSAKKGEWNEYSVTLPEDTDMTLSQQIGIQCITSGEGEFTLYVDSIDW